MKEQKRFSISGSNTSYERESVHKKKAAHEGKLCIKGADILAVDDNEMNLTVVKGLLKHCNVTPDTAQSGNECIQ